MKKDAELQAGIFVAIALGLFFLSIFTLGRERSIFARLEEFSVTFTDVKGLSEGAPIRMGGITVGRVKEIGFSNELNDPLVYVKLLIDDGYLERIRLDAVATIDTQGLLGDKYITLVGGAKQGRLAPGSLIEGYEAGDISQVLAKAGTVVDNAAEISELINQFLEEFKKNSMEDLARGLKSLSKITTEVESGEGLIHRLIYSKKDGQDVLDSLSSASRDLKDIISEVKEGDGLVHALVYEEKGQEAVRALIRTSEDLATTATHINEIAAEIINGEGVAHDLIYTRSPEGLDDAVRKLHATAENLEKASAALARGEGTLGALLVDSQLYDNLVEVTDGAKRSMILRHAIRSSMRDN